MVTKHKGSIIVLIFCGAISVFGHCKKNCATVFYNFELGIRAYPDRDSVNIGDTIFFEIDEPVTLNDAGTGLLITYNQTKNLGTAISFAELISTNVVNQFANNDFKIKLFKGVDVARPDTNRYREYLFAEVNQRFQFKIGVIPQKKGVYKMFVSNSANVSRENDKCAKANFAINFKNTNQHLYLNEISFPGVILPAGGGVYLFRVK